MFSSPPPSWSPQFSAARQPWKEDCVKKTLPLVHWEGFCSVSGRSICRGSLFFWLLGQNLLANTSLHTHTHPPLYDHDHHSPIVDAGNNTPTNNIFLSFNSQFWKLSSIISLPKRKEKNAHLPSHHTQLAQARRLEAVTNQHLKWHCLYLLSSFFEHRQYHLLYIFSSWFKVRVSKWHENCWFKPWQNTTKLRSTVDRHSILNEPWCPRTRASMRHKKLGRFLSCRWPAPEKCKTLLVAFENSQ